MLALRTTDLDELTSDDRDRLLWLEHARIVEAQRLSVLADLTDVGHAAFDAEMFPPDQPEIEP